MATGQVGFHDTRKVSPPFPFPTPAPKLTSFLLQKNQTKTILLPNRINATINRLQKTRTQQPVSELAAAKESHQASLRASTTAAKKVARKEEERLLRERRDEKWKREHAYEDLMRVDPDGEGGGRSNAVGWDEDDFM